MSSKITRLNRESDPPNGKLASPTPQYWDRETEEMEDVEGLKGAPFSMLLGPNGEPIGEDNPLETRVRELEKLIGAIVENPAANTVQARLKAIRDALTTLADVVATDTTLEAVKTATKSIADEDFATEVTLEALKTEIEKLTALIDAGRLKTEATLTGQTEEVIFPRAVRQSNPSRVRKSAPEGVLGLVLLHKIYGVTGTFGQGQGASARATCRYDNAADEPGRSFQAGHEITTLERTHTVFWYPGAVLNAEQNGLTLWGKVTTIGLPLQKWLEFSLAISGTFDTGQGVDSEVTVVWVI